MDKKVYEEDFITLYSHITDISIDQVKNLLEIQDSQCTKYSRVKTCYELWRAERKRVEDYIKSSRKSF